MSCIEIHLERIPSSLEFKRRDTSHLILEEIPEGRVSLSRILDDILAYKERICSTVSLQRQISGVSLTRVCDTYEAPYLEINPTVIWVYPDWAADNDVYSNTTWTVQ